MKIFPCCQISRRIRLEFFSEPPDHPALVSSIWLEVRSMVSRTFLSVVGFTVWTAVLVTAAPRAISHRYDDNEAKSGHSVEIMSHNDAPVENCSDLHIRFDGREAVVRSEERTIT